MTHVVNKRTKAKVAITRLFAAGLIFAVFQLTACVEIATSPGPRPTRGSSAYPSAGRVDSRDADRLRRVMIPLIRAMDRPCRIDQVRVGIIDQNEINAANASSCAIYVTMGL